ncbi:MAG: ABC transporter permease, partial [Bacillota bacterium]|nr:ABC transporter permease [Bacillota bacterium]
LPVLSLPVLMPLLLIAVETTRLALEGASFRQTFGMLSFLVSYGIVIVTVSFLLFDFVWS